MRHHHHRPAFGAPTFGAVPPGHAAAYADGRRLREMSRRRHPGAGRHGRNGPAAPVVFALLAIPLFTGGIGSLVVLIAVGGVVATAVFVAMMPLLFAGFAAFVITRQSRRRAALRRGGAAGTAPLPARPAAVQRPDRVWGHARSRFHALRGQYAAYECDAMEVLRLPALADVSVSSTGRFVDAFAEAQALETDAFPGGPHAAQFVAAVDRAERAWRAARDAAERIRLSGLTPAERGTVERVIKLLTTARDSDSDAERLTAYTLARSELAKLDKAGVVHVPLPARSALDVAARGALPA